MYYLVVALLLKTVVSIANADIDWQSGQPEGTVWANGCDFPNNDIGNQQVDSSLCAQTCVNTPGCTHFAWNPYDGGMCWMKSGPVTKSDAVFNGNNEVICGIISSKNDFFSFLKKIYYLIYN